MIEENESTRATIAEHLPSQETVRAAPPPEAIEGGEAWKRVRQLALKQLNRFMTLEPKVLRGDDPDAIHDMRVASRRLQQILDLMYPKPRAREIRGLRRKIRRSRRRLSGGRNRDVMEERGGKQLGGEPGSASGMREAEDAGVPSQGVLLNYCGCEHWTDEPHVTDTVVERVIDILDAKKGARYASS